MGEQLDPKDLIAEELKRASPDWRKIERWSRTEVDADPANVRFSVDAGHIQRLGFELVAKQETALAELIKNSYDADATHVSVNFQNHDRRGGQLIIEDNGVGMTFDVVRDAWMRISTTSKLENPISKKYGRNRAGRKGIGRFAVQRLGTKLVLETEVSGESHGIRVLFDWDSEFRPGLSLSDVFSSVEEYEKPIDRERTKLSIFGLREAWSEAAMQRVWKAVLLLQPPFPIARTGEKSGGQRNADPGFEVIVNGLSSWKQKTELSIDRNFLDHAIAAISGEIDKDGNAHVSVISEKLSITERQDIDRKILGTGPLKFNVRYFIFATDTLSGLSFATATEMARNFSGVRIYRDGFRVLPYGEPADDWLGFDRDTARRNLLVPGSNRNFFGQVELNHYDNPLFEETSSREGLIENEVFEDLRHFVRTGLEWAINRIAAQRERKITASQKGFTTQRPPRKPSQVIGTLLNTLSASTAKQGAELPAGVAPVALLPPATQAAVASAIDEMNQYERNVEAREAASLKYEEMLRILASLGLSIAVFGHEIKGIRGAVAAHIAVMAEEISNIVDKNIEAGLANTLGGLKSSTSRMFDLGGYIAGLMTSTESRELRQLSVKGAIERFSTQFDQYMARQGVKFIIDVQPENLRTIEMHSSEIDSVLLNFLTNSMKSMKRAKSDPRSVRIFAREDGEYVLMGFEDNGGGVPSEIEENIFDAFFTTTMGTEDDTVVGPGTGLGLKIVSDIARSYGGEVRLGAPSEGYNCCFEFRILSARASRGKKHDL